MKKILLTICILIGFISNAQVAIGTVKDGAIIPYSAAGSSETAESIATKVNTLTGDDRIEAKSIKLTALQSEFDAASDKSLFNDMTIINDTGSSTEITIGDGSVTESKIATSTYNKLYYAVPDGYISPRDYGAAMDGITNDKAAFLLAAAAAVSSGKKISIDADIFLDVSADASTIFLESNTHVEGFNDANIIVNNLLSPAFIMVLSENISFKNIDIIYDQTYDALISGTDQASTDFILLLNAYLVNNKGVTLNSSNFGWVGRSSNRYTFMIDASENVTFENVNVKSKGTTADKFMIGVFKFKWEWAKNSTITSNVGLTAISKNITFKNVTLDGYIMGFQGCVEGLDVDGVKAYRWADAQSLDGSNQGGLAYWMSPPHLFYLNTDASPTYTTNNIKIQNVIDYGILTGTTNHRNESSGYCTSLKMVNDVDNVIVDNYKSYRRDGLGEIQNMTNAKFNNIYAESEVGIFNSSYGFNSFRFLGEIDNVHFSNIELRDKSTLLEIYPLDLATGNNSSMSNFHVYIEGELNTASYGLFGFSGSNNTIKNTSVTIGNHTSTQADRGVLYMDNTYILSGANNHYEVDVYGWKNIDSSPFSRKVRMLIAKPLNPNRNYAKVNDFSNNFFAEQINESETDTYIKSEIVALGSGTQETLTINVPYGFAVKQVKAITLTALDAGTTPSLGTISGTANNLLTSIPKVSNEISINNLNETVNRGSTSTVYLRTSTGTFASTGSVKIIITLTRTSLN